MFFFYQIEIIRLIPVPTSLSDCRILCQLEALVSVEGSEVRRFSVRLSLLVREEVSSKREKIYFMYTPYKYLATLTIHRKNIFVKRIGTNRHDIHCSFHILFGILIKGKFKS
jgi:hypothetical protein